MMRFASLLLIAGCATAPPPAPPPITLDLDDPIVDAVIAGVPMRLRVDFQQKDVIELNPAAAGRLALEWEDGFDVAVGRVVLQGRQARAPATFGGVVAEVVVAEHGRDCCAGVDGAVSPAALPFDPVRLVRGDAPAGPARRFAVETDGTFGVEIAQPIGREAVRVRLALQASDAVATAGAGAILAKAQGGRLQGATFTVRPAFGVARQARLMRFARPPLLLGFALPTLAVRFADFSGGRALPRDDRPGDLVVSGRRRPPQRDWPAVSLGRAQLDRCREIAFHRADAAITLDCRFDG